jgi:hypothetical protein
MHTLTLHAGATRGTPAPRSRELHAFLSTSSPRSGPSLQRFSKDSDLRQVVSNRPSSSLPSMTPLSSRPASAAITTTNPAGGSALSPLLRPPSPSHHPPSRLSQLASQQPQPLHQLLASEMSELDTQLTALLLDRQRRNDSVLAALVEASGLPPHLPDPSSNLNPHPLHKNHPNVPWLSASTLRPASAKPQGALFTASPQSPTVTHPQHPASAPHGIRPSSPLKATYQAASSPTSGSHHPHPGSAHHTCARPGTASSHTSPASASYLNSSRPASGRPSSANVWLR